MAYTEGISLEVVYTAPEPGNTFSYATIQTTDDFADSNQIVVRWEVVTVEDTLGNPVQTQDLTASVRDQIYQLDNAYLTFNPTASSVTVDGTALSGATVTVTNGDGSTTDYVYGDFTLINAVNPVKVRRSVNVSNPVVDFQSGSRLTSGQLNAAVSQLLFASQEQSVFGASGADTSVDLGGESINNLGDVNINLTNSGSLLTVGPDGVITDSTTSGTNEVLSVNGETGFVVLDYTDVAAAPTVHTHVVADLTDSFELGELEDVDTTNLTLQDGDTVGFNGTQFAGRRPVEMETGTGAPPSSWTDAAYRQVGDLFIRYNG